MGRDLFDLWYIDNQSACDQSEVVSIFQYYLQQQNLSITKALFEENLIQKLSSEIFIKDMEPLLVFDLQWDVKEAAAVVNEKFISCLPGDSWKGAVK